MTYLEAMAKLESLVKQIEDPESPLDGISTQVKEAMELVKYCKACLKGTEEELEKIIRGE